MSTSFKIRHANYSRNSKVAHKHNLKI